MEKKKVSSVLVIHILFMHSYAYPIDRCTSCIYNLYAESRQDLWILWIQCLDWWSGLDSADGWLMFGLIWDTHTHKNKKEGYVLTRIKLCYNRKEEGKEREEKKKKRKEKKVKIDEVRLFFSLADTAGDLFIIICGRVSGIEKEVKIFFCWNESSPPPLPFFFCFSFLFC